VVEEQLIVPTYSSGWASASIAAHRGLALPFQIAGEVRRRFLCLGSASVDMLEIGREKLIGPIATRLFGPLPPPQRGPARAVWSPAELARLDADLVITEVHRWMAPRFQRAGWLLIPGGVRWCGDLATVPPTQPCQSLRDDLRKVRNNGFTIEHTSARSDWEEFYTRMVRPQALARHGDGAWMPSSRLRRHLEKAGILHLVSLAGARVAGTCSIGHGDVIWFPVSGVREGDRSLMQRGAGIAALALALGWARSQGYRQIDLGRTSPFVNDGIHRFKRKWGLLPVPDPLAHLMAVLVRSARAREAFSREPVMVESGRALGVYAGHDL